MKLQFPLLCGHRKLNQLAQQHIPEHTMGFVRDRDSVFVVREPPSSVGVLIMCPQESVQLNFAKYELMNAMSCDVVEGVLLMIPFHLQGLKCPRVMMNTTSFTTATTTITTTTTTTTTPAASTTTAATVTTTTTSLTFDYPCFAASVKEIFVFNVCQISTEMDLSRLRAYTPALSNQQKDI